MNKLIINALHMAVAFTSVWCEHPQTLPQQDGAGLPTTKISTRSALDSFTSAALQSNSTGAGSNETVTLMLVNTRKRPSASQTKPVDATAKPPQPTSPGCWHDNVPDTTTRVGVTTLPPAASSRFDAGSFLGGMLLAFIITLAATLGYKLACARRDVRYRTLTEEHDAII